MSQRSDNTGPEEAASPAASAERNSPAKVLTPARIAGFVAAVVLSLVVLPWTSPAPEVAERLTAQVAVREHIGQIDEALASVTPEDAPRVVVFDYEGPQASRTLLLRELRRIEGVRFVDEGSPGAQARLEIATQVADGTLEATGRVEKIDGPEVTIALEASRIVGSWTAVLPPLFAVLIALFFRRLIVALGAAVWLGAAVQTSFNPIRATVVAVQDHLWPSVADTFSLYIIAFTFSLVGMVQVVTRMGGMRGVLDKFAWLARSARSTQLATAMVGLAIFFDDYANTIVTGTTMRPLADQKRVSREKLAYVVDSTSAPIAGLAIISTWIGYEVGLFDVLAGQLGMETTGYEIFFQIIPLRFYCIFALAFVFLNGAMRRDFGPMLEAERRAQKTGRVLRPGSSPLTSEAISDAQPAEDIPHRWINAAVPVAVVIGATLMGMFWSGWSAEATPASIPGVGALLTGEADLAHFVSGWAAAWGDLFDWSAWRDAFSSADNAKVLFWAALLGSIVAIALAVGQRLLSLGEALSAWLKAIPAMWLAVAILVLAWSIQSVCSDLGTSIYLVGTVQDLITPTMLPLLTFLLASLIAFATGTSWGTMGILLPAIIPLAFFMTRDVSQGPLLLMLCFGAVLDGAIFGDHCSPISDTTVMSSIASAVDHIDHVRTQFPYAVTAMLAAALLGYVGVAMGLPIVAAHVLGIVGLAGVLWLVGRSPDEEAAG